MEVKLFAERGIDTIEPKINDFIKDKKVIDIKINGMDGPTEGWGVVAMVMFEEKSSNHLQQKQFNLSLGDDPNEFMKTHDVVNVRTLKDDDSGEIITTVTYRED